jgi:hypothetical protein
VAKTFKIEGSEYETASLSDEGQKIWQALYFTLQKLDELNANQALLTRAKNAYIADLKGEVIEKKSGVDLGALFMDD